MWEPVGPLPAAVYRRRRCAAALVAVAVLGLLTWSVVGLTGLSGPTTSRAASRAAVSAPQPAAPPPASASAAASTPGAGTPSGTGPEPAGAPRPALPGPPPIPGPAAGTVACSDDMIKVAAEIDPAQHRVGQRPTLRLVVTNAGKQPCVRDLDPARQEIVVWSPGGDRLWSSNDCGERSAADLRTLLPGQPVGFAVTWSGRTSSPGCTNTRNVVPAGSYRLLTRVDGVISAGTDFQRLP